MVDALAPLISQLRATLGKMEVALGAIVEAIAWTDETGRVQWSNTTFDHLVNRQRFEVLGSSILDLLPLEQEGQLVSSAEHPLSNALREQLNVTEVYEFRQADQRLFLEISSTCIQFKGHGTSAVLVLRDITERKRVEEALRESQRRLSTLIDSLPGIVFSCTNNPKWSMTYMSEGCLNLTGYTSENLLGNRRDAYNSIIHAEDFPKVFKAIETAIALKQPYMVEYRIRTQSGQQKWLWEKGSGVFDSNGDLLGLEGFITDITERKRAEADIRTALEKEKELGELKSRFVTMASHEFRTPLATILSSTELIEHYSHKLTEEKKLTHLQRIQASVKHMTGLLNDVLLIGKAEAGKLEFKPKPLNLVKFCRELVEEMELTASIHKIDFHTQSVCTQNQCLTACIDEKLLRHILSNLLSNAIKYSPQGGTVHVELICKRAEAIFHIQDEGIGIPTVDQAQLFDSFHRASNVGTISGTGLGLAIVKNSVDSHGGKIAVHTEVGVGTTFTVTLPFSKQV